MPAQVKFHCEKCATKYSLPEERVAGKILKIRCMKCGELIVVKGGDAAKPATAERPAVRPASAELAPAKTTLEPAPRPVPVPAPAPAPAPARSARPERAQAAAAPAPAGRKAGVSPVREKRREIDEKETAEPGGGGAGGGEEWFYSKGGKQIGPVSRDDMCELIAARSVGPKTYAWREGMEDWSRLSTIEDFRKEIADAAPSVEERRLSGARPAAAAPKSAVSEAARKRDEEIENEIASSGVFDDLLRDMDRLKSGQRPAADDGDRFKKVAGIPVEEPKRASVKPGARSSTAKAQAGLSEEDLPFVTSPRPAAQAEPVMFESELEAEARRQAMEIAETDARESAERAQQIALAQPQEDEEEPSPPEPRESTRVIILKAGLSKKSRMKKLGIAAAGVAVVLAGLTWLVSTKLNAIYNFGLTIVKPQFAKPLSTEEINMTPEERERYRKMMLGMEEEKKQEEQQVVKKKTGASKRTALGVGGGVIDTSGLADAYAGLGKQDIAAGGRMDSDGKPMDIGGGIGGLGTGGIGMGGVDFGKKIDLPDLKPDLGTVFKELTADQVGKVVAGNQRSLSYCYEKHLKGDSGLSGKVMIWAEVKGTGKVGKVKSLTDRIRGSMIEECLVREIRKWQFPRFEGDSTAIEIPLVLTSTF